MPFSPVLPFVSPFSTTHCLSAVLQRLGHTKIITANISATPAACISIKSSLSASSLIPAILHTQRPSCLVEPANSPVRSLSADLAFLTPTLETAVLALQRAAVANSPQTRQSTSPACPDSYQSLNDVLPRVSRRTIVSPKKLDYTSARRL
ncbi:hypothetical protein A0H81_06188 [Grifola frondosa]|uniref:Uncharacterized protein n=1 Tax=Grifola frondosa TaxID=5627 RepID=A0A1C7M9X5_GRIFR|nr:hypothetical protein A0H81_06188 [Grifola frondosa]